MKNIMHAMLAAGLAVGLTGVQASAWAAKEKAPHEQHQQEHHPQGVEHMSEQGAANANSPATGDQLKGEERADERHAIEHESHGQGKPSDEASADDGRGGHGGHGKSGADKGHGKSGADKGHGKK